MTCNQEGSHRRQREIPTRTGSGPAAGRTERRGKPAERLRRDATAPDGNELMENLCEVMKLFPAVSEEAVAEFAGRMMAERLRCEAAGRNRRLESGRTRRRKTL